MSCRFKLSAVLRALAVPTGLLVITLTTVSAQNVVIRLQVCLSDIVHAHDAVMRAGESPIEETLFAAVERTRAARSVAGHVVGALTAVSFFGAIAFLLFGTPSRLIRSVSLVLVLLLLFRACFWTIV
jgi:hypothetical protein